MLNRKTQQFAKFYLKDLKNKNSECNEEKLDLDRLNFSLSN